MTNKQRHVTSIPNGNGVPFKENWPIERVRAYTKLYCNYWLDEIYDYGPAASNVANKTIQYNHQSNEFESQELDEFMWEEWTTKLEESRLFVFETLQTFGLTIGEAHFLSIKVAISAISKFRLRMFIDFGGQNTRSDFEKTALRNAINYLGGRFRLMKVYQKYMWSVEAADEKVTDFCKEVAVETANILVEDTGAILHAKLVL